MVWIANIFGSILQLEAVQCHHSARSFFASGHHWEEQEGPFQKSKFLPQHFCQTSRMKDLQMVMIGHFLLLIAGKRGWYLVFTGIKLYQDVCCYTNDSYFMIYIILANTQSIDRRWAFWAIQICFGTYWWIHRWELREAIVTSDFEKWMFGYFQVVYNLETHHNNNNDNTNMILTY